MAEHEHEPRRAVRRSGPRPWLAVTICRGVSRRRPSSVLICGVGWGVRSPRGWRGVVVNVGRWLLRLGGESW
jgi:hypothetical protein